MRSTLGEVYTSRRRHSTCTLLVAPLVTIYTRYASPSPSPLPSPFPLRSPPPRCATHTRATCVVSLPCFLAEQYAATVQACLTVALCCRTQRSGPQGSRMWPAL